MECCGHEGPGGDARFDFRRVADGVHAAVAAPAYKVNSKTAIIESDDGAVIVIIMGHGEPAGRDWLRTFRGYIHDMVEAVQEEVATGASLDEVKQRVTARLAPTYEPAFATYQHYRPWRQGLLANIERTYAMVS